MKEEYQTIKFYFETSQGPGNVTVAVGNDISIQEAEDKLLDVFNGCYKEVSIVDYEIIKKH